MAPHRSKKKFVSDGEFYAQLNEVLTKELGKDGYSGVDVKVTPTHTQITIRATQTQNEAGSSKP